MTWPLKADAGDERVRLTWRELGGPSVSSAPQQTGFGSTLIEQSLPEAQVERPFLPEGLVCTITLELKPAVEGAEHRSPTSKSG